MAQETAAEKAEREAREAADAQQAKTDEAVAAALAEQRKAYDATLEAERQEFAAQLAAATSTGAGSGAKDKGATSDYELLADVMHVPNDGDLANGYTTYARGDKVPLTSGRAAELIEAGAVKDPDADDGDALPADPEKRAEATQTKAPE